MVLEHFLGNIHQAVAGSLCTGKGAAEAQALTGEHALRAVRQFLVLTVQVTYLAGTGADVAGGYVLVRTYIFIQLIHKCLAEAHHFHIALALGVKVRAALGAADGQASQAVFEDLLKAQKLDDRQVYAGVQAQTAFVGADGGVKLHAVAAVYMHLAMIVYPRNTEHDLPFRLNQPLQQAGFLVFRIVVDHRRQCV